MRTTRPATALAAATLGLVAPLLAAVSPTQAAGITYISFEDLAASCNFASSNPLRDRYAAAKFRGPSSTDGGAVLNTCGSFGVAPRTGVNFLAFRTGGVTLANGGIPRGPEKISLPVRQKKVTIWVSQSGASVGAATFRLVARRGGNTVTSATVSTATAAWAELTVQNRRGIDSVTLSAPTEPDGVWLADDLTMVK
jgi:hypothetical protein